MPVPRIDHVVIDVGDRLDEAARLYRTLGFSLTERAQHSLGSYNQLCVFGRDYLEFLSPGTGARADLAGFPVGLNGLVFALTGADAVHDALRARGIPVQPVQRFSRNVDLPGGARGEARFNVIRVEPRAVFDGRVYFCEHMTPDMIWRPEWQAHPNGAIALARIALSARNPDGIAEHFDRMFGAGAVERPASSESPHVLRSGEAAVEIWPRDTLACMLGAAMPDPAGRADHIALVGIRVRSLDATKDVLRTNGIRNLGTEPGRIIVPPAQAMNVALEFVADQSPR
jgi:catechol 2,3-dioxygenase-like lactoylglutathione lyase family enzyme